MEKYPPFAVSLIYLWYTFTVVPNIDREGQQMKQMLRKKGRLGTFGGAHRGVRLCDAHPVHQRPHRWCGLDGVPAGGVFCFHVHRRLLVGRGRFCHQRAGGQLRVPHALLCLQLHHPGEHLLRRGDAGGLLHDEHPDHPHQKSRSSCGWRARRRRCGPTSCGLSPTTCAPR